MASPGEPPPRRIKARLLVPFAVAQGLWVKARTPELPTARGKRGRIGQDEGPARFVVGVGDSIIAGTGVGHQREALTGNFARVWHERAGHAVEWRALGLNGATSAVILHRIVPHAPAADVYVLSAGVNDSIRGVRADHFAENLRGIVRALRAKAPRAVILYSGMPHFERFPSLPWPLKTVLTQRTQRMQSLAQAIATEQPDVLCYEPQGAVTQETLARDGFHPSAQACAEWAERMLDHWQQSS
ncbi:MAG TPA: SGNH/GDSL hydrolase family protein [Steroidobacteraceae bacterium]